MRWELALGNENWEMRVERGEMRDGRWEMRVGRWEMRDEIWVMRVGKRAKDEFPFAVTKLSRSIAKGIQITQSKITNQSSQITD